MMYYILPTDKDIQHHGVLGMKWGVRKQEIQQGMQVKKANKKAKLLAKAYKAQEKAIRYSNKAYKKSMKDGVSNLNRHKSYSKSIKYMNKSKKLLSKAKRITADLSLASPELKQKYAVGQMAIKNATRKHRSLTKKHKSMFGTPTKTYYTDHY